MDTERDLTSDAIERTLKPPASPFHPAKASRSREALALFHDLSSVSYSHQTFAGVIQRTSVR